MSIKDRLLKNGAIITTTETNFGEYYLKEVEIWYRNDSQALRESVDILSKLYPGATMFCSGRPGMKKDMLAVWSSKPKSRGPDIYVTDIYVTLDIEDCSHCNPYVYVSLETLLAKIREHGPKDSMAFRIRMDGNIWQQM